MEENIIEQITEVRDRLKTLVRSGKVIGRHRKITDAVDELDALWTEFCTDDGPHDYSKESEA